MTEGWGSARHSARTKHSQEHLEQAECQLKISFHVTSVFNSSPFVIISGDFFSKVLLLVFPFGKDCRSGVTAQLVEYLPGIHEAPGSMPSIP